MPEHFDEARWALLSPLEQLGNIGSEVGRTMTALQRGDYTAARGASLRAFDLIDATVANWSSEARRREFFAAAVDTASADPMIDRYFFEFVLAARSSR